MVKGQLARRPQHAGGGVRHDDIQTTPGFADQREKTFHVVGLGDVALEHQRADASFLDFVGGFLRTGAIAEIIDGDIDLEVGQ
jgi:hypothetical protein